MYFNFGVGRSRLALIAKTSFDAPVKNLINKFTIFNFLVKLHIKKF